jgi:hypothetical protein
VRVISFESARITRLFPIEEFAPAAGANSPSILSLIAQRYGFTIVPTITTRDDLNKNGLLFGMGHFQFEGQPIVVNDFGVYTDGLAAVTQKSEWSEAFLDDVMAWVKTEFHFREITSGIQTLYSNTVVVEFEHSPARLLRQFEQISNFISERAAPSDRKKKLHFARLDLEVDRRTITGPTAPKFVLERRPGVSFEQERYFSAAPMTTADHIAALEELERIAATT